MALPTAEATNAKPPPDSAAANKKRRKAAQRITASALGVCFALSAISVASWLIASGANISVLPSLPFGLFVAAGVALLLAADALVEPLEKALRRRPATLPSDSNAHSMPWHSLTPLECVRALRLGDAPSVLTTGLSAHVAAQRLLVFGPNRVTYTFSPRIWRALLHEVHEPQQLLLLLVAVLYALVGEAEEAGLALGVIALMIAAEVLTEFRAKKALASLQTSAPLYARVIRDGAAHTIPRHTVVPGDMLLLKAGYDVPCDARLISSAFLECNESSLTGESVPVHKRADRQPAAPSAVATLMFKQADGQGVASRLKTTVTSGTHLASPPLADRSGIDTDQSADTPLAVRSSINTPLANNSGVDIPLADIPLADRSGVVHAGTTVTRGSGRALAVSTGSATEIGRVLASVRAAKTHERKTALQTLLKRLAATLTYVALLGSLFGGLLGLVRAQPWQEIVLITLSLAFATIPEELPILISAVLAVGASSLSRSNVFVKRLRAMEALAYVDVVLTDKTGTLTTAQLRLVSVIGVELLCTRSKLKLAGPVAGRSSTSGGALGVAVRSTSTSEVVNGSRTGSSTATPRCFSLRVAETKRAATSAPTDTFTTTAAYLTDTTPTPAGVPISTFTSRAAAAAATAVVPPAALSAVLEGWRRMSDDDEAAIISSAVAADTSRALDVADGMGSGARNRAIAADPFDAAVLSMYPHARADRMCIPHTGEVNAGCCESIVDRDYKNQQQQLPQGSAASTMHSSHGAWRSLQLEQLQLEHEEPFDPTLKLATRVFHDIHGNRVVYIKGAPEMVLACCRYAVAAAAESPLQRSERSQVEVIPQQQRQDGGEQQQQQQQQTDGAETFNDIEPTVCVFTLDADDDAYMPSSQRQHEETTAALLQRQLDEQSSAVQRQPYSTSSSILQPGAHSAATAAAAVVHEHSSPAREIRPGLREMRPVLAEIRPVSLRSALLETVRDAASTGLRMVAYARLVIIDGTTNITCDGSAHIDASGGATSTCSDNAHTTREFNTAATHAAASASTAATTMPLPFAFMSDNNTHGVATAAAAPFSGATLLGILCFQDPLRPEAATAVQICHGAGVCVVMVTGDHPLAALAVASATGIVPADPLQVEVATDAGIVVQPPDGHHSIQVEVAPQQQQQQQRGGEVQGVVHCGLRHSIQVEVATQQQQQQRGGEVHSIQVEVATQQQRGGEVHCGLRQHVFTTSQQRDINSPPPPPSSSSSSLSCTATPQQRETNDVRPVLPAASSAATSTANLQPPSTSSLPRATAQEQLEEDGEEEGSFLARAVDDGARVFARATPGDKLALVCIHQSRGHTVAVTGEGVNDAPALAQADVGIAVQDATDVAREACAIVVIGGDFTALVRALEEGRRLFDNLVHALAFYLGAKLGLLLLFVAGTLWAGFPLAPVQVIVLELFMDLGASTSFVAEQAEADIMARPPRSPTHPFFDRIMLARIVAGAISMCGCVLAGYAWGLYSEPGGLKLAQSMSFVCWLLAHVLLAFNQRTAVAPVLLTKDLTRNRVFLLWTAAMVLLAVLVGCVRGLDDALSLVPLSAEDWGVAVAVCVCGTFWIEGLKVTVWVARGRARAA